MPTNFPTGLDGFTNPTRDDLVENTVAALDHDVQHRNNNDALMALQAKVGINGSAVPTSLDARALAVENRATVLEGRADLVEGRAGALEAAITGATTPWQSVTLNPPWALWPDTTYSNLFPYRLWQGVVHLRGIFTGGTAGVIFTLPPGYRPLIHQVFECRQSSGSFDLRVNNNGDVWPVINIGAGWASLSGARFVAEH